MRVLWNAAYITKHPSMHRLNALPMVTGQQYWPLLSSNPYPTQDFPLPTKPSVVPNLTAGTTTGKCEQIKLQHAWDTKLSVDLETIDSVLRNLFLNHMPMSAIDDWNRHAMTLSDEPTVGVLIAYFTKKYGKTNPGSWQELRDTLIAQ